MRDCTPYASNFKDCGAMSRASLLSRQERVNQGSWALHLPHGEEPHRGVSNHEGPDAREPGLILRDARRRAPQDEGRRQEKLGFLFVLITGLIAGTISGIVGTGSSIMLMPVLVYEYGPK